MTAGPSHDMALPHDIDAERFTLAAMLGSGAQTEQIVEVLTAADFYRPAHADVFHAMIVLWAQGLPVDTVTVCDYVGREMSWRPFGGEGHGRLYVAELGGMLVPNGAYHARIVRTLAVRRLLGETGLRLMQRAGLDGADPYEELGAAEALLGDLAREVAQAGSTQPAPVVSFLAREWKRLPPVIPGLLDHEDRAIVTGWEGDGKTTLLLQLGFGAAAGIHPFACTPIPAKRVCWINLENPVGHVVTELTKLREVVERYGPWGADNLIVWNRRQGLDLSLASQRARLAGVLRGAKPDLVIGGPIYKMVRDKGQGAEQLHSVVTNFWDDQIERLGFALVLETHMPGKAAGARREAKPIGSSIYQRWPEFGITMDPGKRGEMRLGRFRKDRIRGRVWPVAIEPNRMPGWPWVARYDDVTEALGWETNEGGGQ